MADTFAEELQAAGEAPKGRPSDKDRKKSGDILGELSLGAALTNNPLAGPLGIASFGANALSASNMGFGAGMSMMSALANTLAGKAFGIPDPTAYGSTIQGLPQGIFGGADVNDFTPAQMMTTAFGRGATPDMINATYGTGPNTQGTPPSQLSQELAGLSVLDKVKELAARSLAEKGESFSGGPSSSSSSSSGVSGGAVGGGGAKDAHFQEGGIVGEVSPLKKLFMGVYE